LALLNRFAGKPNDGCEWALTTDDGKCLYRKWTDADGKAQKRCPPETALKRLKERAKVDQPITTIRKTSSTIINNIEKGLGNLFLGHAPRTTGERFYFDPDLLEDVPPVLDDALDGLRERLIGYGVKLSP